MSEHMSYRVEGTAALKGRHEKSASSIRDFSIVAVPGGRYRGKHAAESESGISAARKRLQSILDASEMYCSLKFEDFRGVPYQVFTTRGIAVLSSASAAIAVLSIAIGA